MNLNFGRSLGWLGALAALIAIVVALPQLAAADTVKGMITARDGAHMTVTASDGTNTVITLNDDTRVTATSGRVFAQSTDMAVTDLIPGLPVRVTTSNNGSEIDAVKVEFKASDLKTAQQVEAGTAPVKAENEALKKRLAEANQYVLKGETTVLFATGSAKLSPAAKQALKDIAAKALTIKGYLIGVTGHADTTGNSDANQALSEKRAETVIRYLQKFGGVQPYRVLSSTAMGEDWQIGESATTEGKAQNRRAVVQVLTNKGLEGLQ